MGLKSFIHGLTKPSPKAMFDGASARRRLRSWVPPTTTTNVILTMTGELLRARARDAMRNNPHANAACDSFVANLIGTGIKPSSLYREKIEAPPPPDPAPDPTLDPEQPVPPKAPAPFIPKKKPAAAFPFKPKPKAPPPPGIGDNGPPEPIDPEEIVGDQEDPVLRDQLMKLWMDWTDECDADGLADFYGMQTIVGRALFEAGECFIRFRPRKADDGLAVPLQIQLLESDMCPYSLNIEAPNGNWIMNGIELDLLGKRAAYWFYPIHPGDAAIEVGVVAQPTVRVPASEVLHIYKCTRPGQMRGVPMITPALVRMFLLDQYDDAELERKRIAAMFAGFVTSAVPEDILANDGLDLTAPQEDVGLSGLEPGTMQMLRPGEDIKFSEPADVGGSYEAYQYRQQLALFAAVGIPYSLATSDLRRANYSSLRGSIVEYRRKLEQMQHNIIVFQMCTPIWKRWMDTAVLAEAIEIDATEYMEEKREFQRAKWIPQRNDWVDPLKDRQAEKLAVEAGFKSRSDVIEAEGSDPEENDKRIAADKAREKALGLDFSAKPASPFGGGGGAFGKPGEDGKTPEEIAQEAADQAADDEQAA